MTDTNTLLVRLLSSVHDRADDIREQHGISADGITSAADTLSELSTWLPDEDVGPAMKEAGILTAEDAIQQIVTTCEERGSLVLARIKIEWRSSPWNSRGMMILGTMKKIGKREIQTWVGGKPPHFKLSLNLPYWLIAEDHERLRLIHHELGHADYTNGIASSVPHPVEEFPDTAARFGPLHAGQVALALAISNHPLTPIKMREWAVDDSGQALLPWGEK